MELILKNGPVQAVVTTKGAELISFKDDSGKEYIWNGNPEFWSGRNPVLFPTVGTLKDGKIEMDGKIYEMGRHGFGRISKFAVAEQSENHVVFELKSLSIQHIIFLPEEGEQYENTEISAWEPQYQR